MEFEIRRVRKHGKEKAVTISRNCDIDFGDWVIVKKINPEDLESKPAKAEDPKPSVMKNEID